MVRKRRPLTPFSLAFLDVMSCGFGAAVLLFLLIKHGAPTTPSENVARLPEPPMTREDIEAAIAAESGTLDALAKLRQDLVAEISAGRTAIESQRALRASLDARIAVLERQAVALLQPAAALSLEELQSQLSSARAERDALRDAQAAGRSARRFAGDGEREYITGMKMNGRRQLILLDTSASMLHETLVNILRTRNLPEPAQRAAPKWQRALATLDWLTARVPLSSELSVAFFGAAAEPASRVHNAGSSPRSAGWVSASDRASLDAMVAASRAVVPSGGTSLAAAFAFAATLEPVPDTIHLITDGLPTLDATGGGRGRISGERRLALFESAVRRLPPGVAVNVILLPLEGDPAAAAAYWRLAQLTGGTLITPAGDWP